MNRSSLVELIKTFSSKEMRRFTEFVSSPFYNKNKKLTALCSYLKLCYPRFLSRNLQKEKVFAILFPGKRYDDAHFRYLLSSTLTLAERYLAQINAEREPANEKVRLLAELDLRMLDLLFRRTLEEMRMNVSNTLTSSLYSHLSDSADKQHHLRKFLGRGPQLKKYLGSDPTFGSLSRYYIYALLESHRMNIEMNISYEQSHHFNMVGQIYRLIEKEGVLVGNEALPIRLNYFCCKMIAENNEKYYLLLRDFFLDKNSSSVPDELLKGIATDLANFLALRGMERRKKFRSDKFNIYKRLLESDRQLFLDYGKMDSVFFMNCVGVGLAQKDLEWTESFIEDYQRYLSEEDKKMCVGFCRGMLHFNRKEFRKSLKLLATTVPKDFFVMAVAKKSMAQAFYELGDLEAAEYQLKSLRELMNQKGTVRERVKRPFLLFNRSFAELIRMKPDAMQKERDEFVQKVEKTRPMSKDWLLQKVKALR